MDAIVIAASAVLVSWLTLPSLLLVVAVLYVVREIYVRPTYVEQLPIPALLKDLPSPTPAVSERVCVVTGAAGFLGKAVVEYLANTGDYDEIRAADIAPMSFDFKGVVTVKVDMLDAESLQKLVRGSATVYHIAAVVDLGYIGYTSAIVLNVNTVGTVRLINACLTEGVRALVYASSVAAVQIQDNGNPAPGNEEAYAQLKGEPITIYGLSKKLSEKYLRDANAIPGSVLRTTALRPYQLWGPGNSLGENPLTSPTITVFPSTIRHRTAYIFNLARWFHLAGKKLLREPNGPSSGNAYFVADGEDVAPTFEEFHDLINKYRKSKPIMRKGSPMVLNVLMLVLTVIQWLGGAKQPKLRLYNPWLARMAWWDAEMDISKGVRDLGYTPYLTMDEAVKDFCKRIKLDV